MEHSIVKIIYYIYFTIITLSHFVNIFAWLLLLFRYFTVSDIEGSLDGLFSMWVINIVNTQLKTDIMFTTVITIALSLLPFLLMYLAFKEKGKPWEWHNFFVRSAGFDPQIFETATSVPLKNEKFTAETVGIVLFVSACIDGSLMALTLGSYGFPLNYVIVAAMFYATIILLIMRGLIQSNLMGTRGVIWIAFLIALVAGGLNSITVETFFFSKSIKRELVAERQGMINETLSAEKNETDSLKVKNQGPLQDSIQKYELQVRGQKDKVEASKSQIRDQIAQLQQELLTARGQRLSEVQRSLALLRASLNITSNSDTLTGPDRLLRSMKADLAQQIELDEQESQKIHEKYEQIRQGINDYYEGEQDFISLAIRHWNSLINGEEESFAIALTVVLWFLTMIITLSPLLLESLLFKFKSYKAAIT